MKLKRWTEAIALRMSIARLKKAKRLVEEVAYLYGDVDNYVVIRCGEFADQLDAIHLDIVAAMQARVEDGGAEA